MRVRVRGAAARRRRELWRTIERRRTLLVICLLLSPVHALDIKTCANPLGMESGEIPDSSLTASSSYVSNVGPQSGRLNQEHLGGGWCPKGQVEANSREYIEIALGSQKLVTALATQGRHGQGRGMEYMEEYTVEYFRSTIAAWHSYDRWDGKRYLSENSEHQVVKCAEEDDDHVVNWRSDGPYYFGIQVKMNLLYSHPRRKVFTGNSDTVTVVHHSLTPPVHANIIRVYPHSLHLRTICLRLELYGCADDSGVLSYSAPAGSADLGDHTDREYDGVRGEGGRGEGGLGRLTDGQVGGDFFLIDMGYAKGSGWVGWRNSSFPSGYLEIIFSFDGVRNITQVDLFTNNYYSRSVQIFRTAVVYFSIGGKYFNGDPVISIQHADKIHETARNISIPFNGGRVSKFVRIRLYFESEWIMLSEVYFASELIESNATEETEQKTFDDILELTLLEKEWEKRHSEPRTDLMIGSLAALIILLIIVFILILIYNKRSKYLNRDGSILGNHFSMKINMKDLFTNFNSANEAAPADDPNAPHPSYEPRPPMIIEEDLPGPAPWASQGAVPRHKGRGTLHRLRGDPEAGGHFRADTLGPRRKQSYVTATGSPRGRAVVTLAPSERIKPPALSMLPRDGAYKDLHHYEDTTRNVRPSSSKIRETHEYYDISGTTLPPKRKTLTAAPTHCALPLEDGIPLDKEGPRSRGGPSAGPSRFGTHLRGRLGPRRFGGRDGKDLKMFGLSDLNEMHRRFLTPEQLDNLTGAPAYVVWNISPSMTLPFDNEDANVTDIPISYLNLMTHFGKSPAGDINIYETNKNLRAILPFAPKLVQIRTVKLRPGETNAEYLRELRFLLSIDHPSICRVFGVIARHEPAMSVSEYTAAGDLCQMLKSARRLAHDPIRFPLLIFMSIQICSAMKYLESRLLVHKDLATRNCLIYPFNRVKITDMAMCSEVYRNDYHSLVGQRPVPVRWLSWESLLMDRYTCPSTVWSFGVTLWEILTLCQQKPYSHLELDHLLKNAEKLFYGYELKDRLPQPDYCPDELYAVMNSCWRRNDGERPTFHEIHAFLLCRFGRHVPLDYSLR